MYPCIPCIYLKKNVVLREVQGNTVTPQCFGQVPSLHFLLLIVCRISPSRHLGFPHTIAPKTVSNHHDGLNVLFNTSMKHFRAEPIIIVYPHPQALHSLVPSDRSRGTSQLRMKPGCDCSGSDFWPLGVMMAAALHRG